MMRGFWPALEQRGFALKASSVTCFVPIRLPYGYREQAMSQGCRVSRLLVGMVDRERAMIVKSAFWLSGRVDPGRGNPGDGITQWEREADADSVRAAQASS